MDITPMCRALALHEIFDSRGITAGGAVPLAELERSWPHCGLRTADLAAALSEAHATGEFATEGVGEDCRVILTELGYEQSQRDLSSLRQIEELIRAYAVLGVVRRRRKSGPMFGRRRSDKLDS